MIAPRTSVTTSALEECGISGCCALAVLLLLQKGGLVLGGFVVLHQDTTFTISWTMVTMLIT